MKEIDENELPPSNEGNPALSEDEHKQVQRRSAPRAAVVYETVREEGEFELQRPLTAVAWSGLAAGLSMGFSMVAEGLLRAHLPAASWSPLVYKFGYSAGYLIVILGRQQLFTENTLTVILPLLLRKDGATLTRVLQLWAVVLSANLIGAFVFAVVVGHTDIFQPEIRRAFGDIGSGAMSGERMEIFLRAIFAGWLIAMMVWLLPAADSARLWVIIIVTYLVGLGGYAHIIAGSVEGFYATMTGHATWAFYFGTWVLPTLLGNIVGGVSLVAVLGHVQVVYESSYRK